MKKIIKTFHLISQFLGFYPMVLFSNIRGLFFYISDLRTIKKQMANSQFKFGQFTYFPILQDKFNEPGTMKGHYFHQDLLIARKIFEYQPVKHLDIGSRIDGFVAHVAVFRAIEIMDIRKLNSSVKNITFTQADFTSPIPEHLVDYCDSLSSLHAIEHFGLGRYGDKIDYLAYLKAFSNISKILKKHGKFYLSLPIGHQRIEFNGQRVFSVAYLIDLLQQSFTIDSFSFVNDSGELQENVILDKGSINNNFGCIYGCGIFELTKN